MALCGRDHAASQACAACGSIANSNERAAEIILRADHDIAPWNPRDKKGRLLVEGRPIRANGRRLSCGSINRCGDVYTVSTSIGEFRAHEVEVVVTDAKPTRPRKVRPPRERDPLTSAERFERMMR